jgi:hypothetical protein
MIHCSVSKVVRKTTRQSGCSCPGVQGPLLWHASSRASMLGRVTTEIRDRCLMGGSVVICDCCFAWQTRGSNKSKMLPLCLHRQSAQSHMGVYCAQGQLQISFPMEDLLCLCGSVHAPSFLSVPLKIAVRLRAFALADSNCHAHGISAMGGVWDYGRPMSQCSTTSMQVPILLDEGRCILISPSTPALHKR